MEKTGKTAFGKLGVPIILFLALMLAACAGMSQDRKDKKLSGALKPAIEAFNSAFRWEDYPTAMAFVPAAKKEQFWAAVDKFKGKIHLVDYQIRDIAHQEGACTASAIIYFQYWRTDSPVVQTVTFTQKWFYVESENAKEKGWKVQSSGYGAMTAPL